VNQYNKVIEIIFKEFKKVKENPVTERELKKVKEYLKGGMLLNLESTTNRMMRIANSLLYFNRIVPVDEYLKKIESITADDVLGIANEILDESNLVKVILRSVNG
jgi:predicted Zn-dependent peptidase